MAHSAALPVWSVVFQQVVCFPLPDRKNHARAAPERDTRALSQNGYIIFSFLSSFFFLCALLCSSLLYSILVLSSFFAASLHLYTQSHEPRASSPRPTPSQPVFPVSMGSTSRFRLTNGHAYALKSAHMRSWCPLTCLNSTNDHVYTFEVAHIHAWCPLKCVNSTNCNFYTFAWVHLRCWCPCQFLISTKMVNVTCLSEHICSLVAHQKSSNRTMFFVFLSEYVCALHAHSKM